MKKSTKRIILYLRFMRNMYNDNKNYNNIR
jgi:hypothetical protein